MTIKLQKGDLVVWKCPVFSKNQDDNPLDCVLVLKTHTGNKVDGLYLTRNSMTIAWRGYHTKEVLKRIIVYRKNKQIYPQTKE